MDDVVLCPEVHGEEEALLESRQPHLPHDLIYVNQVTSIHEVLLRKPWVIWITDHLSDPTSPFLFPNSHSYVLYLPVKSELMKP